MVNGDRSALADLRPIWILVAVLLAMCAPAFAQGAGILPDREARESDRDNPLQREAWFRRGRTVKGKSAAALFYRAYQQKMKLRAARLTRGTATMAPFGAGSGWSPLGPTQFSSQSNGASQDYGFVSGRVTAWPWILATRPGIPCTWGAHTEVCGNRPMRAIPIRTPLPGLP